MCLPIDLNDARSTGTTRQDSGTINHPLRMASGEIEPTAFAVFLAMGVSQSKAAFCLGVGALRLRVNGLATP